MRAVPAVARKGALEDLRGDLAALSRQAFEFETMAEKLRRAAFVGRDVRFHVAKNDTPRRGNLRERQRIGRGAGRHQESRDISFENFA